MTRSDMLEHLIIQGSSVPLTDGTKIPTQDPGKAGQFGDMKPRPMRIQLLQITGMVKNAWHLLDLPVLKPTLSRCKTRKNLLPSAECFYDRRETIQGRSRDGLGP